MSCNVPLETIRNIGIIAHIDAGKTTLTERFLYYSGKTHRIGSIDSGTTVMDYLDEERSRGITIVSAAASFNWSYNAVSGLIHLIDTPGHIDFTAEVERSIRVSDGAVVIFSGVEGVEAQSEKVWRQSNHYQVPKIAFINKLDRLGASFSRTLNEIQETFTGVTAIALQLPVGIESGFQGVIDLVEMKFVTFDGVDGSQVTADSIPQNLMPESESARDNMLTALAEISDQIAELYLDELEIATSLLRREIRRLTLENLLCPVLAGSAKKNIGIQPLLDSVIAFLPSPEDRPVCAAVNAKSGEPDEVNIHESTFCGLVFKIIASGSADLLYLRIYSGRLTLNDSIVNARTGEKVRIKRILRLYSKNVESIEEAGAGDIIGIIGPQNTFTGDTLCNPPRQVLLEKINFPDPVISIAIEPKSNKDKDRLSSSLELLCREDPTLTLTKHENTGQLILSGMGELHLEINTNRLHSEFKIEARYGKPRVAFRETIPAACSITGVFDRIIGDNQFYAEVDIELNPEHVEQGIAVMSAIHGKEIPGSWIKTARETLNGALKTGGNLGYPLIYIKGTVKAIRGLPDKTTDGSVAGAVMNAVQQAVAQGTTLLEPLMRLDITAPEDVIGEINGYLQSKRAVIHGMDNVAGAKVLHCEVPLAEMFGFSSALPKLSGGRASFTMEPHGYQEISRENLLRMGGEDYSVGF